MTKNVDQHSDAVATRTRCLLSFIRCRSSVHYFLHSYMWFSHKQASKQVAFIKPVWQTHTVTNTINQSINLFFEKYHINKTIQNIMYQVDKTYKAH